MIPFTEPADGWQPEEKLFLKLIILNVYRKILDPVDKFIFIAIQEAGYTQSEVAAIIGISQVAVHKRFQKTLVVIREKRKQGEL